MPERRGAAGADPLVAALVTALLLLEPLLECLQQLFPAAERLDLRFLLLGEVCARSVSAASRRATRHRARERLLDALEVRGKCTIEAIEVLLILHERRACEPVEVVHAEARDAGLERLEQRQVLCQRNGDSGFAAA